MKKLFAFTLALLIVCVCGLTVLAADTTVTVTISDGTLALANASVVVTDIDGDGILTINDALTCAHDAAYPGGSEAGYACATGDYGLYITKLWGVENGGSYGYYVNNISAMSLNDKVQNGDSIAAFVYTDTVAFSDTYCWFDVPSLACAADTNITLTLTAAGYDANWAPITMPVADAVVTLNGNKTDYITDANGQVSFTVSEAGDFVISAVSDTATLVPTACNLTVTPAAEESSEFSAVEESSESASSAADVSEAMSSETVSATPSTGDTSTLVFLLPLFAAFAVLIFARRKTSR